MSRRQTIEIVLLGIVCIASLRAWFWKDPGFTPQKKLGLVLALVVFVGVGLLILTGH